MNSKESHKRYRDSPKGRATRGKIKRRYRLLSKFGLRLEEYNLLLESQCGGCAICRGVQAGKRLSVDHDHVTGKVRGLLCQNCNLGLGIFKDSEELLKLAQVYLWESKNKPV